MNNPNVRVLTPAQAAWLDQGPALARGILETMAAYGRRYTQTGEALSDPERAALEAQATNLYTLATGVLR